MVFDWTGAFAALSCLLAFMGCVGILVSWCEERWITFAICVLYVASFIFVLGGCGAGG